MYHVSRITASRAGERTIVSVHPFYILFRGIHFQEFDTRPRDRASADRHSVQAKMAEAGRPKRKAAAKAAIKEDDTSASVKKDKEEPAPSPPKKARGGKKQTSADTAKPAAAEDVKMTDAKEEKEKAKADEKVEKDPEEAAAEKPKKKAAAKPKAKAAAKPAAAAAGGGDDEEDANLGPMGPLVLPPTPGDLFKIVSWNVNGLNGCMDKPGVRFHASLPL